MRRDAAEIFREAIFEMLPDRAVKRSLSRVRLKDEIILIGIGKASWIMAKAASEELKERIIKCLAEMDKKLIQSHTEDVRKRLDRIRRHGVE